MQSALLFENGFLQVELLSTVLVDHGELFQADLFHELLEALQRLLLVLDAYFQRHNLLLHSLCTIQCDQVAI